MIKTIKQPDKNEFIKSKPLEISVLSQIVLRCLNLKNRKSKDINYSGLRYRDTLFRWPGTDVVWKVMLGRGFSFKLSGLNGTSMNRFDNFCPLEVFMQHKSS
jgi:hypothetical protein